jgi:YVTN family beta-propeller protein
VSVIDTTTNTVVGNVANLSAPLGETIASDGARLYVANYASSGTVSVIDTASNSVVMPVTVGSYPRGVAVKTAGSSCSTCGTFPFSAFSVKLEVDRRAEQLAEHSDHENRAGRGLRADQPRSGFELKGAFSLAAGASSTGIDPVTQPVTLQVSDFSITIPKGSFRRTPRGKFVYEGVLNGVRLEAQIAAVGINEGGLNYAFRVEAKPVSLTGVPGTLPVQLQIGNNTGKTSVRAGYDGGEAEAANGLR